MRPESATKRSRKRHHTMCNRMQWHRPICASHLRFSWSFRIRFTSLNYDYAVCRDNEACIHSHGCVRYFIHFDLSKSVSLAHAFRVHISSLITNPVIVFEMRCLRERALCETQLRANSEQNKIISTREVHSLCRRWTEHTCESVNVIRFEMLTRDALPCHTMMAANTQWQTCDKNVARNFYCINFVPSAMSSPDHFARSVRTRPSFHLIAGFAMCKTSFYSPSIIYNYKIIAVAGFVFGKLVPYTHRVALMNGEGLSQQQPMSRAILIMFLVDSRQRHKFICIFFRNAKQLVNCKVQ